jgi:hypothetical protein
MCPYTHAFPFSETAFKIFTNRKKPDRILITASISDLGKNDEFLGVVDKFKSVASGHI